MGITSKQIERFAIHRNYISGVALYNSEMAEFVKHEKTDDVEYFHFEVYLDEDNMYSVKINSKDILDSECNCSYQREGKICEHIVAGGLMIKDVVRRIRRIERNRR